MSQLSLYIAEQREKKPILAMTHVIYGYPTVDESLAWMDALLSAGAEILEVQFPFSDPVADGPAIVAACHNALENKVTVSDCLASLGELQNKHPNSRILLMSYLNPMYRFGLSKLVRSAGEVGISGLIIPDLPYEQATDYLAACEQSSVDPIWLVTPVTPPQRLAFLASHAQGLLYCVSRSGVTGQTGEASNDLDDYLNKIRPNATVPLALGFGIREKHQVDALKNKADIAIVGSALLDAFNQGGVGAAVEKYTTLFH